MHALAVTETDSLSDPGLLAEILEAREELESATSADEVETLRETNGGEYIASHVMDAADIRLVSQQRFRRR